MRLRTIIFILCALLISSTICFSAPDSVDKFCGWNDLQTASPKAVLGNNSDACDPLILTDVGAFAGGNYAWQSLQPNVDKWMFWVIRANTDDQIFVWPSDRLGVEVQTNGDMELESSWYDYGTPTTNERSSAQTIPWGSYSRHVVGDADGDGIVQTGLQIDKYETDCSTDHSSSWSGEYMTTGYIYIVSGTPRIQMLENDGTTLEVNEDIGDDAITGRWQGFRTGRSEQFNNVTFTAVTIDSDTDTISAASIPDTNDEVVFRATTTMPTGLDTCTTYYVINAGDGTFQISETRGGSAFNFSDTGTDVEWGGTGEVRFVCSGGPCEFYLDDVTVAEYEYGMYTYNYPDLTTSPGPYSGTGNYYTTYNEGTDEYAVYRGWQKEYFASLKRWAFVNPMDNFHIIRTLNNYNASLSDGVDFNGLSFKGNWTANPRAPLLSSNAALIYFNAGFKAMGWNAVGANLSRYDYDDDWNPPVYGVMPQIRQVRLQNVNKADIGRLKFGISSSTHTMDNRWPDVFDPQWAEHWEDGTIARDYILGTADGDTTNGEFRQQTTQNAVQFDVTPYIDTALQTLANPYVIGWDTAEEPEGIMSYNIMGYMIMISHPTEGTSSTDGVNDTKAFAVNYLRGYYSAGDEDTFVANISEDGANQITIHSSWSTVPGYVSAAKDAAALAALNASWGTTYSGWEEVYYEDGDDDVDRYATGKDANAGFEAALVAAGNSGCAWDNDSFRCSWDYQTASEQIEVDLDHIHAGYGRYWTQFIHQYFFGENGQMHGQKVNFGPGFDKFWGWLHGMKSKDETEYYVDLYAPGGAWGGEYGVYEDSTPAKPNRVTDWIEWLGLPVFLETGWIRCEPDSAMGFKNPDGTSRTIDAVYKRNDADKAVYIGGRTKGWDCDATIYADIGDYCAEDVEDHRITEDATVYWNCSDPLDSETCEDSGTLFWQFIKLTDQPYSKYTFFNRYIIIADQASIGNLDDNDLVTDGVSKMFTIIGSPYRASMIVDEGANFDTNWNNPNALDHTNNMYSLVDEDDPAPRRYYHLAHGFATERSLICWKEWSNEPPAGWKGWSESSFVGFRDVNPGDHYHLNYIGVDRAEWLDIYYETLTQEDTADMVVYLFKQAFGDVWRDSAGDQLLIGLAHFGPIDDGFNDSNYGGDYAATTGAEVAQFGYLSNKCNWYGPDPTLESPTVLIEATRLGRDGIAETQDDEVGDYGDRVSGVKEFFTTIYQWMAEGYEEEEEEDLEWSGVIIDGTILQKTILGN
jgi:hypothetical protein